MEKGRCSELGVGKSSKGGLGTLDSNTNIYEVLSDITNLILVT